MAYAKENGLMMLNTGDFLDFLSKKNFEFADKYLMNTDTIYAAGNHDFCHRVGYAKEDYQYKWDQIKRSAPHLPNNLYFYSRIIDGPHDKKLEAFGFHVISIDGHDFEQIEAAFAEAKAVKGKPTAIVAKTIKGKGVSFMENKVNWHGAAPNDEQCDAALAELNA